MLGPKALIGYLSYPEYSLYDLDMLVPLLASVSAVLVFELFKLINLNLYLDNFKGALSWCTLMLVRALAFVGHHSIF